jgi:hypothetical protein
MKTEHNAIQTISIKSVFKPSPLNEFQGEQHAILPQDWRLNRSQLLATAQPFQPRFHETQQETNEK